MLLLEIPEVFVDLPRGSTGLLLHPSRHRRNVRGQLVPVESLRIPGLQGGFESEVNPGEYSSGWRFGT